MARNEKLANNYARAILAQLGAPDKALAVAKELGDFARLMEKHTELKAAMTSVVFSAEQRRGILEDLSKTLKLSESLRRVLLVVSENGRLRQLSLIAERLRLLALQSGDVVPLAVWTSAPITDSAKAAVEGHMQKVLGKKVDASYELDPGLIGGLRVSAAGKTYDGTLAGWLAAVEDKLVGGQV